VFAVRSIVNDGFVGEVEENIQPLLTLDGEGYSSFLTERVPSFCSELSLARSVKKSPKGVLQPTPARVQFTILRVLVKIFLMLYVVTLVPLEIF